MSERVHDLSPTTRAIIGLSEMGIVDHRKIARHVFQMKPDDPIRDDQLHAVYLVLTSDLPTISLALNFGLPAGASAHLHRPVWCESCGHMVRMAPCVACYMMEKWTEDDTSETTHPYRARKPRTETQLEPGSADKIELMKRRVDRGEAPCHQNDKQYEGDDTSRPEREPRICKLSDIAAAMNDRSWD